MHKLLFGIIIILLLAGVSMMVVIDRQNEKLADQSTIIADAPIIPLIPHCEDRDPSHQWNAQDFFPLEAELTPEAKYHALMLNLTGKELILLENGVLGLDAGQNIFISPYNATTPKIIEGYDDGGQYYQYLIARNILYHLIAFRYGEKSYPNVPDRTVYPTVIQDIFRKLRDSDDKDCEIFHDFLTIGGKYSIPWEDPAVPEERRFMLEEIFQPLYEAAGIK